MPKYKIFISIYFSLKGKLLDFDKRVETFLLFSIRHTSFLFHFFPLESENGKMTAWKRKIPLKQKPSVSLLLGAKTFHPFSLNSVDFVYGWEVTLVGRKQGTERVEREKCFFEEAESRDQETAGKRGNILLWKMTWCVSLPCLWVPPINNPDKHPAH